MDGETTGARNTSDGCAGSTAVWPNVKERLGQERRTVRHSVLPEKKQRKHHRTYDDRSVSLVSSVPVDVTVFELRFMMFDVLMVEVVTIAPPDPGESRFR